MTVRAVEGKKLWEGGTAITVDNENKIISLNLRDENNLIIYDEGDDEIYVDLQLPDGIRPTDAFPVGITTGRVLVADDWDVTGTLICAKTTSGDNIKVLYGDDNKLYVDNGTGIFKQVYLKPEVDALLATYATIAYVDSHDTVVSATAPETPTEGMLWYNTTTGKLKVYNGTDWDDVGGGGGGGSYTAGNGIIIDQNDEISVDTTVVATQTDLGSKQDELVSGTNIKTVNSNSLLGSGDVSINEVPSGGTDGQVLTKVSGSPAWANPTGGGGDVSVSTDTGNELTTGAKLWLGLESDFSSITTPDSNTMYIQYITDGGGGWQPGANTVAYYEFDGNLNDGSGNGYNLTNSGTTFTTLTSGKQVLSVEQASASYSGGPNLTGKSLTASFWFADTATRSGYSDWSYFKLNSDIFWATHSGPEQGNLVYAGVQGQNNGNDAPSYNDLVRHYVVITFDTSTKQLKEYIDNSLKATTTLSNGVSSTTTDIIIGGLGYEGQVHFQMGDLIIEDKVRTAQEISDYYDLTKGDYGIS